LSVATAEDLVVVVGVETAGKKQIARGKQKRDCKQSVIKMNTRLDTLDWWFGERSEAKLVILGFNNRGCIQPNQLRVVTVSARLIADGTYLKVA
jgi:hypothetical protein